ncbi:LysR family transcriptional regulator [Pseudomonas amygdali pv. morsprunorum]|nr:LysR family transcriptional regulator [Pseudomonas amygdali pv. morsprunorum]PPS36180.1 hypothetical protein BVY10_00225 [Pseudomonas amygdali pv. morsprunorum]
MIAVPIGPRLRMAVVASPEYFRKYTPPVTPGDLAEHSCIDLRLPTHGSLLQWDFEKDGHELKARVEGQWNQRDSISGFKNRLEKACSLPWPCTA